MQDAIVQTAQAAQAAQFAQGLQATQAAQAAPSVAQYAAADASMFAAVQQHAAASVAAARDLVGNGAQAATLGAEAAAVTATGLVAGFALPVVLGTIGVAGLAATGYYAWKHKGFTIAGTKQAIADSADNLRQRFAKQGTPGEYPQWEGYTDETIWNDLELLEAETRPDSYKVWAHEIEDVEVD